MFNHVSLVSSKRRHAGNLLSILSNVSFLFAANKTRSRERINKVDKTWMSKRRRVASLGKQNCFAAGKLNDLPVRFGNERVPAYSRAKVEIACAQRPRGTKQAPAIYPVANILRSIRRWKNRKESLRVGGVARNCVSAIRSYSLELAQVFAIFESRTRIARCFEWHNKSVSRGGTMAATISSARH